MTRLHAVDAEATFGRHERGAQDNVVDATRERGDDAGHDESAGRVRDEHDRSVTHLGARGLDVGDDRRDLGRDGDRRQVRRLRAATGKIDRERGPVEKRHEPVPVAPGAPTAVDEYVRHRGG